MTSKNNNLRKFHQNFNSIRTRDFLYINFKNLMGSFFAELHEMLLTFWKISANYQFGSTSLGSNNHHSVWFKLILSSFFLRLSFHVFFLHLFFLLSSGYYPDIVLLSSGYRLVIVQLLSGYHPVNIQLLSSYRLVIVL